MKGVLLLALGAAVLADFPPEALGDNTLLQTHPARTEPQFGAGSPLNEAGDASDNGMEGVIQRMPQLQQLQKMQDLAQMSPEQLSQLGGQNQQMKPAMDQLGEMGKMMGDAMPQRLQQSMAQMQGMMPNILPQASGDATSAFGAGAAASAPQIPDGLNPMAGQMPNLAQLSQAMPGMGGAPGMGGMAPGLPGMGGMAPGLPGMGGMAPGMPGMGGMMPGMPGMGGMMPGMPGMGGMMPGMGGMMSGQMGGGASAMPQQMSNAQQGMPSMGAMSGIAQMGGAGGIPQQFQQMMQPPSMAQMQQQAGSQVNVQDLLKPQMDLLPSMNDAQAQQAQQFRQATPGQSTGSNMGEQQLAQTGTDAKFTSVPGVPMQSNVGGLSAAVGMYHPYVNPFLFPLAPHKYMPPPPGPAPYPMPSFNPPNYYSPSNDFVA